MAAQIRIDRVGEHMYSVKVRAERSASSHRVIVPPRLLAEVGVGPEEEELLVRISFEFLLEREPPTSILAHFGLDVIGRYFPEYVTAMRTQLAQTAD